MTNQEKQLRTGIKKMFQVQKQLNRAFPQKPFTPDGRMIGDIGEAIAGICYQVTIDEKVGPHWDGTCKNKQKDKIQIKTTGKNESYLKKPPYDGKLLVFRIFEDGHWEVRYNGPIVNVWKALKNKKASSMGEKMFKLDWLLEIDKQVKNSQRVGKK